MKKENFDNEQILARWLAKELSDKELIEQIGQEEFNLYQQLIDASDQLAFPAYDTDAELNKLRSKIDRNEEPRQKHLSFPLLRYAAAAVVLVGLAFLYYLLTPNYTVHHTDFGESLAIDLPDGSQVILASNSEISYDEGAFNSSDRQLKLQGQAFFDVEKGKPFEVITPEGVIRVLGTTFDVDQRENVLNVVCYTGSVGVKSEEVDQVLQPSDAVRLIDGVRVLSWQKNAAQPSWLVGITEINEANLQIAVNALRNIYGFEIKSTIDLTSVPFDGAFPHNNIDIALQSVLGTEDITYTYEKEQALLTISEKR